MKSVSPAKKSPTKKSASPVKTTRISRSKTVEKQSSPNKILKPSAIKTVANPVAPKKTVTVKLSAKQSNKKSKSKSPLKANVSMRASRSKTSLDKAPVLAKKTEAPAKSLK